MTDDLVAFLAARLGEDEAAANAADPGPWEVGQRLGSRDSMVFIREEGALIDTVGITYRDPVFTSQVPNKTQFRENAVHIARHDPARVLREVAAKRAILARLGEPPADLDLGEHLQRSQEQQGLGFAIRHLAAVYADHPDYQPEWRP